jgi:hypothetical protein
MLSLSVPHYYTRQIAGTYEETEYELARLETILKNITTTAAQEAAADVQPAADDWGGTLLQRLHVWQRMRVEALEAEIRRVSETLAHVTQVV